MSMSEDASDPDLGKFVHKMLDDAGLECPIVKVPNEVRAATIRGFRDIIESLGLNSLDDSLNGTPRRIAKMYAQEIFWGLDYNNFPRAMTVLNEMKYDEMIAVQGITVQSMCEHHFLPFIGTATVAYIPAHHILGLSKFNRIVEFFSRRPQIQERLTEQIAATLGTILECDDVAVVIKADHYCVKLRGAQDVNSVTTTSKMLGRFKSVPALREEFISLTR